MDVQNSGYIGITDSYWYEYNRSTSHKEVVFWRRKDRPIEYIFAGMPFFFLVKGTNPRCIRGYGIVKDKGQETVKQLWEKYGDKMGNDSLSSVEFILNREKDNLIGYYFLENVRYIDEDIDLADLNIDFPRQIVVGKPISREETIRLLSAFDDENKINSIPQHPIASNKLHRENKQRYGRTAMLEENFENILSERLDDLEEGLTLVRRQYSIPVGRIDLFCTDKDNNLVVIELKKFDARNYSIIDQISRYMGYIKDKVAKENQKVRGIIVVGNVDEKLKYSAKAIPDLQVKTFKFSIV
jgi:hypothetical protein